MAKKKSTSWGYGITIFVLLMGALFLFFKTNGAGGGFMSNGFKTYGYFQGGKMTDDLDVRSLRWHSHDGFERLVFDIYKWDGVFDNKPFLQTQETGIYQIGSEMQGALSIDGELSGYRGFSAQMPNFKQSNIIKDMEVFPTNEKSYLFTITLKHPASYKVFTLKNPTRLIIDIK